MNVLLHDMNTAWTPSAATLAVSVDPEVPPGAGGASNRFVAAAAALNALASIALPTLDLREFDEIRFWIRADRAADGSVAAPFYLEFFYVDATAPATEFRWLVPVNRTGQWEQRQIGFRPTEPRASVARFAFRALTALPFNCQVAELLAVREQMLPDAESSLTTEIERNAVLPGLANIPQPALTPLPVTGDIQIVLVNTPGFAPGNRIRVTDGARSETFNVQQVIHAGATTTLVFSAGETILGPFVAPVGVSAIVPAITETSLSPTPSADPSVIVTLLDAREDLQRSGPFQQRDSFWRAGGMTFCSTRPAPRAYALDYQLTARGTRRQQQLFAQELLLSRLSLDSGLRINGAIAPLCILPPWPLEHRRLGEIAPVYVRIGTHLQTSPRREQTWVRHTGVLAAQLDAPLDFERVEADL
jgi:hypothetical protein